MAERDNEIRDAILRHLLKVHKGSRSPKSAALGIQKLQQALKSAAKYKAQEVSSNLDYLVQKGWVQDVHEPRSYSKGPATYSADQVTYKISATGMDLLEGGASLYSRPPTASNINLTNINGVMIVGDGNVVNTQAADLPEMLEELGKAVIADDAYPPETKLNVAADIGTIQSQLQKPKLDKGILKKAWAGVQTAVTAGEAVELATKAGFLIANLIT